MICRIQHIHLAAALAFVCSSSPLRAQVQEPASAVGESAKPAQPQKPAIPRYPAIPDVVTAMKKAATYYRRNTSVVGGYAWKWPRDLSTNKGEDEDSPTLMMIQPPGTPAVGMAMLQAFRATDDRLFAQAAREAAQALFWSQLASGGWGSSYDFDPRRARKLHYRRDIEAGDTERGKRHAESTLDDDKTESALLFLVEMLHTPAFANDADLRASVRFGFDGLIAAQAPNGGWGQHFDGPADTAAPVKPASLVLDWPHQWPGTDYTRHYTLNDNNILNTIRLLLRAHELEQDERLLTAARRAGDFLLLAQLPDPQPAWAQQYDRDMHPVWARKFEPPAVASIESLGAMRALLELWCVTGDEKYRAPIPRALAWLEKVRLPDGQWARFYEMGTNRPLYCKRETYEVTYDDTDLPTHYGFKSSELGGHIGEFKVQLAKSKEDLLHQQQPPEGEKQWTSKAKGRASKTVKALESQSGNGFWLKGEYIDAGEFVRNVNAMAEYVEAARKGGAIFAALRAAEAKKAAADSIKPAGKP